MITEHEPTVAVVFPTPAPAEALPPRARRRGRLRFLLAGLVLIAIILAAGGVVANAALSQTYSAKRAVQDYFAAQAHRNADGMRANATFTRGDGSFANLFDRSALQAMLELPANSDIRDLKVISEREIDGSTRAISVSLTWNGKVRNETLTVRKDPARTHWLLYTSWRVDIPSSQIQVKLPNQAGTLRVDGVPLISNGMWVSVIQGFHKVSTDPSSLLEAASANVDAVETPVTVTLPGTINATALHSAQEAVKSGLHSCDAAKYDACFDHTYSAPDSNFDWYFSVPGYGNVSYAKYVYTLTGDPTSGMKLTVLADSGKVSVSGTCTSTLTVNGSRTYTLKGDFSGTLTWNNTGVASDLTWNCAKDRA